MSPALRTPFTERVGCEAPVQVAPMPGTATPELAAAVASAGGVGMLGAALFSPDGLARALAGTTGAIEAMALYAGEGVGSVVRVEPAAEIVRDLVEGAARLLERASLPRTSSNS